MNCFKISAMVICFFMATTSFGQIIFVHDTTQFADHRWRDKERLSQYRQRIFGDDSNLGKKTFTVASSGQAFSKIYLLNAKGEVLSSDFIPSNFFSPNDNFLVVTGGSQLLRDSFNPYGAIDIGQALFVGAINRFISEIKNSKQAR